MTSARDSRHRSDEVGSAATSTTDPGKQSRSGAFAVQRKASAPPGSSASAPERFEPADDPFALHLPVQRQAAGAPADDAAATTAGAGSPLPGGVQSKMESSFATDFSDVRVHEGPQASQMGALAYAQGTDIHFAPGQFNPGTEAGDSLIGHELAHVQQQRAGQVATPQGKGAPIVDDHALESEADRAGERAARGEPAGMALGSTTASGGAIQLKGPAPAPAKKPKPKPEEGPDTFGLEKYLEKLKAKTGVSGAIGKYAEAKLGVTTPPIPQLGGGAIKIEGEGRYLTSSGGNELEISLHLGVKWGIDFKLFKADVEVFGEGKVKLQAQDGGMLECLNGAIKGVMYDALRTMTVRNVATLANPMAARAAEWALGESFFDLDVFKALGTLAGSNKVPDRVSDAAKKTLAALKKFFGEHSGSFDVSIAVGIGGEAGSEQALQGGGTAKVVHGISGEDGDDVSDEKRRNELAIEAHLKKGGTEGKVGYVFGGGRDVLTVDASFLTENTFDFDKAKLVSLGGIAKMIAAVGLGTSLASAKNAPSGGKLVNALVGGLASGAGVIGGTHLPGLKKSFKLSLEIEREGKKPWKDAKVDCKLFLGNAVGGKVDGGKLGEIEASAAVGSFISISRDVKDKLPGKTGGGGGGGAD